MTLIPKSKIKHIIYFDYLFALNETKLFIYMKIIKSLFAAFALLICLNVNAQNFEVKINPLGILFNSPDISAEYLVNDDIGIQATLGLEYGNGTLGIVDLDKSGFKFRVMGKYYFGPDDGCDKFYAGIYLGPRSVKWTDNTNSGFDNGYKVSAFTAGLAIGFKWVGQKGILFEIATGAGRAFNEKITYNDETNTQSVDGLGLDFIGMLAVGYRFGM